MNACLENGSQVSQRFSEDREASASSEEAVQDAEAGMSMCEVAPGSGDALQRLLRSLRLRQPLASLLLGDVLVDGTRQPIAAPPFTGFR